MHFFKILSGPCFFPLLTRFPFSSGLKRHKLHVEILIAARDHTSSPGAIKLKKKDRKKEKWNQGALGSRLESILEPRWSPKSPRKARKGGSGSLSWRMLGLCCDIFGGKMATKSPKTSQDGAQEPQDEPRWRPRAPR